MKTLKKVLSLVLVVAMIASMLIVGAAAAEEETTLYEEAVAVVTGIGIIEGDENGYNFQGGVTREQAAKIIAYLLLGKETAESLKTTTAPFADVAANRWSAGYVAYLKGQGIISGVSDTEFDPTAPVTGIAFAKMLLTAVGYGKAGEFEGKDWDINTITFANDNGVFTDTLAADLTKGATREEAMLYAFNVLTGVPTVKYNKTFESYYVGPSALNPVTGTADVKAPTVVVGGVDVVTPYAYTLAWTKYELEQTTTGTDDFGRPAASWTADDVVVAEAVATKAPDYVLYGKVTSAVLYNTLGKTVVTYLNKATTDIGDGAAKNWSLVEVYQDGDTGTALSTDIIKDHANDNVIADNGATTEIYVDFEDGEYDIDIVICYEHIGRVTKVDTTANTMTINDAVALVDGDVIDITGYAKGDWVVYTEGETAVSSVRPAESVVAEYAAYSLLTGYTFGGVNYSVSAAYDNNFADVDYTPGFPAATYNVVTGTTYELYLDSQNNILATMNYDGEDALDTYQYVYVNGVDCQAFNPALIDAKDAALVVSYVGIDGGAATANYALKFNATRGYYFTYNNNHYSITSDGNVKLNNAGEESAIEGLLPVGWYTITTDENGAISLRNLTSNSYADNVNNVTLVADRNTIAGTGYTANSKTVLTFIDAYGTALSTTGIANFPVANPVTGENGVLILHGADSAVAKEIVIYTGYTPVGATQTYGFVVMAWSSTTTHTTYMMYVDGAMQFITIEGALPTMGMYEVVVVENSAGVYELTPVTMLAGGNDWTPAGNKEFAMTATNAIIWTERATIGNVDDNFFQTVAIDAVVGDEVNPNGTEPADDWNETNLKAWSDYWSAGLVADDVPAVTYYYDEDTIIYDCVTGGIVTELNEGDCFMAKYVTDNAAWDGVNYCEYIWIVG